MSVGNGKRKKISSEVHKFYLIQHALERMNKIEQHER